MDSNLTSSLTKEEEKERYEKRRGERRRSTEGGLDHIYELPATSFDPGSEFKL